MICIYPISISRITSTIQKYSRHRPLSLHFQHHKTPRPQLTTPIPTRSDSIPVPSTPWSPIPHHTSLHFTSSAATELSTTRSHVHPTARDRSKDDLTSSTRCVPITGEHDVSCCLFMLVDWYLTWLSVRWWLFSLKASCMVECILHVHACVCLVLVSLAWFLSVAARTVSIIH